MNFFESVCQEPTITGKNYFCLDNSLEVFL